MPNIPVIVYQAQPHIYSTPMQHRELAASPMLRGSRYARMTTRADSILDNIGDVVHAAIAGGNQVFIVERLGPGATDAKVFRFAGCQRATGNVYRVYANFAVDGLAPTNLLYQEDPKHLNSKKTSFGIGPKLDALNPRPERVVLIGGNYSENGLLNTAVSLQSKSGTRVGLPAYQVVTSPDLVFDPIAEEREREFLDFVRRTDDGKVVDLQGLLALLN